jgi:hypothetical protein
MASEPFTTPIVLEVFNRPEHTRRVFAAIAAVRPTQLFIMADGPRPDRPDDVARCDEVRAIVQAIDWPCKLRTDFAPTNMGCGDRSISGLTWVFEHVDEVIFIEDDTLPDLSFFAFCREMLARFRDDQRVAAIRGVNLFPTRDLAYSYFFSNLVGTWGLALWRRSWRQFDPAMTIWPEAKERRLLANVFPRHAHWKYWQAVLEACYWKSFSYDYAFALSCWAQGGLTIAPARNLVRNIGFGADSTHTKVDTGLGKLPLQSLEFPLRHPPFVVADRGYDDRACDWLVRERGLPRRAVNRMKRTIGALQARHWGRSPEGAS